MDKSRSGKHGFTLIETTIVIGIITILGGMIAPLSVRIIERKREEVTRKRLQIAFEAMFGSRERRVANMRADFGFTPPLIQRGNWGLNWMLRRSRTASPLWGPQPANGGALPASFEWGFNGPYWTGPVDRFDNPVDAWGNSIDYISYGNGSFQLRSRGPSGKRDEDDNIYYPSIPVNISNFTSNVYITIVKDAGGGVLSGTISARQPRLGRLEVVTASYPLTNSLYQTALIPRLNCGMVEIYLERRLPNGLFNRVRFPLDLLPGESRDLTITL